MPRKKAVWTLLTYEDLAEYRKRKQLRSDAELAEALDVSVGSIAGWKKGIRAPSRRVQQQLLVKIEGSKAPRRPGLPQETEHLIRRLLSLAGEVSDPSALIEASHRLLSSA